jgi:Aspartyl/Asparaginyl beta-hydroxylase
MLELPGQPVIDKASLIGACVRLGLRVDAARLAAEVAALPHEYWGTTAGRVGVHLGAESVFLRGYAPAEGNRPIEDRSPLAQLPYTREIVYGQIPAPPLRCLLARLPAGAAIALHVDRAPYFSQTVRLHLPIITHEHAYMVCAGRCYVMRAGEVWALNNTAQHGVWNADTSRARTHLICDFLPAAQLMALLAAGETQLGARRPDVDLHLAQISQQYAAG